VTEAIRYLSPELIRDQAAAVLAAWGMRPRDVELTTGLMVETDLRGIDSHGISMLLLYDTMHTAGQLRLAADPKVVRESASTALIDAGGGLGHPVSLMAMQMAIDKAKRCDVGIVSVFNSHHFGAAGLYAEMAAREGLIGIVSCTTKLLTVVPTYAAERVLGTNPFAFAAPAGRHPIVLLDMSTSIVAANKVKAYALRGEPIPAGWVSGADGTPLTDSGVAYDLLFKGHEGGLTPIGGIGTELGGHKGYGLALFAQILSSTLGGGSFSPIREMHRQPGEGDNIGQFFEVINPAAFRDPDAFRADIDAMIDHLRAVRPTDPDQPVLIPGDPERANRERRLKEGIPISQSLARQVEDIAQRAGAPYLWGTA
jgi:LDH2 family malate/lactate/ureidoglycolate dehydrogenase